MTRQLCCAGAVVFTAQGRSRASGSRSERRGEQREQEQGEHGGAEDVPRPRAHQVEQRAHLGLLAQPHVVGAREHVRGARRGGDEHRGSEHPLHRARARCDPAADDQHQRGHHGTRVGDEERPPQELGEVGGAEVGRQHGLQRGGQAPEPRQLHQQRPRRPQREHRDDGDDVGQVQRQVEVERPGPARDEPGVLDEVRRADEHGEAARDRDGPPAGRRDRRAGCGRGRDDRRDVLGVEQFHRRVSDQPEREQGGERNSRESGRRAARAPARAARFRVRRARGGGRRRRRRRAR